MKILVQGDIEKTKKYKRFDCKHCGCVFLANGDEYNDWSNQHDGVMFGIECPCCNRMVWNYSDECLCLED